MLAFLLAIWETQTIVHKDVDDREYFSLCSQDLAKLIDKLRPTGFSKPAPGYQTVASVKELCDAVVVVVVAIIVF